MLVASVDSGDVPRSWSKSEKALAARLVARALKRPAPVLLNDLAEPSVADRRSLCRGPDRRPPACARWRGDCGSSARAPQGRPRSEALGRLGPDPWAVSLTVLRRRTTPSPRARRPDLRRQLLLSSGAPSWNAAMLAALGRMPLVVPVVVAAALRGPRADVESLRAGSLPSFPTAGGRILAARPGPRKASDPLPRSGFRAPSSELSVERTARARRPARANGRARIPRGRGGADGVRCKRGPGLDPRRRARHGAGRDRGGPVVGARLGDRGSRRRHRPRTTGGRARAAARRRSPRRSRRAGADRGRGRGARRRTVPRRWSFSP